MKNKQLPASLNWSKIEGTVGINPEPVFPSSSSVVILCQSHCIPYAFFSVSDGIVTMLIFTT